MTVESMALALNAKRSGNGWMSQCPAHDDRNPSLHITVARTGLPLVKCFAGCDQEAVIGALRDRGLWPEHSEGGSDQGPRAGHRDEWREWRPGIRYHADWGTPITAYDYRDARGSVLYSIIRFEPKTFRPGYFRNGRWVWGKYPDPVLYHLPEVLEAAILFLVEGERDVETLRARGFVATTNSGGAKNWQDEYSECLRGRECIIIPDADVPGHDWAKTVARSLLGKAARICVITLPHLRGKDTSDWFAEGHSEVELISVIEQDLCREAHGG